jgi:hypothetical protein
LHGYGITSFDGRRTAAHRVAFYLTHARWHTYTYNAAASAGTLTVVANQGSLVAEQL